MNLLSELRSLFEPALLAVGADPAKVPDYLGMVKPVGSSVGSTRPTTATQSSPELPEYQANFVMSLAKALRRPVIDLASEFLHVRGGPIKWILAEGNNPNVRFLNIILDTSWIAEQVQKIAADHRLGVAKAASSKTFVIDLSGPNVAKPLHVGHLRSTIIGDALVRLLRFLGHTVVGDNHLGDWGTQFGILIYGYKNHLDQAAFAADPVRELARLYIHIRNLAKVSGDDDEGGGEVMEACRQETAKLHAGDTENVGLWNLFMPACLEMLRPIYERLDVKIDHALGESFYNPMLAGVVDDLLAKGLAVESNGAVVVPNAKGVVPNAEEMAKEEPPALVRKRDGAFTYTTTDLATIKYRIETWKPDVILYVVDARQALHFKTLFANAKRWGYSNVEMHHIAFGSILGKDKKPYRTRDGGTVELAALLDDAAELGLKKYEESHAERKAHGHDVPDLTDETKRQIAETVGYGAVKYADLSGNRTSDYIFDYDKMLATEGNTATYMQYAYARCRAIFREGEIDDATFRTSPPSVLLTDPTERALAVQLLKFEEVLTTAGAEYLPHYLTQYLWDVAKAFSGFYVNCPVLKAHGDLKQSRLLLVDLTARTIQTALGLLGIRTVERM